MNRTVIDVIVSDCRFTTERFKHNYLYRFGHIHNMSAHLLGDPHQSKVSNTFILTWRNKSLSNLLTHFVVEVLSQGGCYGCLCRVQNIACYQMRMGFIGVQVAHSVADYLNIYYEQFPCVGTPKFQSRKYTNESWCFLRGHGRAEGLSSKKFFCTRHKHPKTPLSHPSISK